MAATTTPATTLGQSPLCSPTVFNFFRPGYVSASTGIADVHLATPFPTAGSNSPADQLKMVARVVSTAAKVGARRQVFFVSMGGFDTHSDQATVHPALLVLGGAVQGGRFYGTAPVIANNGPDDVGQGRLLPSTSVDQYAARLGRWGVAGRQLAGVEDGFRENVPITCA
jgi:uncharacterized protein (DUF1501 family)